MKKWAKLRANGKKSFKVFNRKSKKPFGNLWEYFETWAKRMNNCTNFLWNAMTKYDKVWQSMKSVLIVEKVWRKCAKSWKSLRKYAKSWESVLKVEKVC